MPADGHMTAQSRGSGRAASDRRRDHGRRADSRACRDGIRLSRPRRTSTNPSVATLIVRDDGAGPVIVGRGVTAIGGRPHAEPQALDEAGALARGATAYVTLEPCAHHGRTPPCADALVTAGVARVVGAASDPDARVSGRGYAILRAAGIEVVENVLADEAADAMAAYLIRSSMKRAQVTLKLALSSDGMIGRKGAGQVAITGEVARRQVQMMRARSDAILVGIGTALADDPLLTRASAGAGGAFAGSYRARPAVPAAAVLEAGGERARDSAVRRGVPGSRSGPQGGAGKGRRKIPRHRDFRGPCRAAGIAGGSGRARHLQRHGRRRRGHGARLSSTTGWSTASCCSAAMPRSAPTALPRRSTRLKFRPASRLKRDETFGNDRCREWTRGI